MAETQKYEVRPGRKEGEVQLADGRYATVPEGWALLPPGDATHTRRVKAAGPSWTVKAKRGRRVISLGVWAPSETIEKVGAALEAERATPTYQRKLASGRKRRAAAEAAYATEFEAAVRAFLDFHPTYEEMAHRMAQAIATHAVPVGSGTVARTKRIPVERRAEAATIAWMRHQTTAYDQMSIPRVKGMRREVRRMLAERSRLLLKGYRRGTVDSSTCPLQGALDQLT